MTRPREVHPRSLWFVTRRTHRGEFRLRPDDAVTNAIGYIVALACVMYGVEIVTFCAMSNHYHATLYDPLGRIADWECFVNSRLAAYLNARHERGSHVFDASEGNAIEVQGDAFISKCAYTLANPTKAGLVYSPEAWPGLVVGLRDLRSGRPRVFRRPTEYFDPAGALPEEIALIAKAPPGWEPEAFYARLARELEAALEVHRAALVANAGAWLTAEAVRRSSPFTMPTDDLRSRAGRSAAPRPRLVGSTPEGTRWLLARRAAFLERYAVALAGWREGKFDVVFPEGTFRLWRSFGARRGPAESEGEPWTPTPPPAWERASRAPS